MRIKICEVMPSNSRLISVNEKLPEAEGLYLGFDREYYYLVYFTNGEWIETPYSGNEREIPIIEWMPLPNH